MLTMLSVQPFPFLKQKWKEIWTVLISLTSNFKDVLFPALTTVSLKDTEEYKLLQCTLSWFKVFSVSVCSIVFNPFLSTRRWKTSMLPRRKWIKLLKATYYLFKQFWTINTEYQRKQTKMLSAKLKAKNEVTTLWWLWRRSSRDA